MAKPICLALWAVPRSSSTIFERSMLQIQNSHSFHEPYYSAYHFGVDRQSQRFINKPVDKNTSYDSITKKIKKTMSDIEKKNNKVSLFLIKDIAKHISNNFDKVIPSLENYQHSFIIRHPKYAIQTLYGNYTNHQKTGDDDFDMDECVENYKQIYNLYEYLQEKHDSKKMPVIDSQDLIDHPSHVMYNYCQIFGLPYHAQMLTWDSATDIAAWQVWNGITSVDIQHGGFDKLPKSTAQIKDNIKYPEEVSDAIEQSLPYYEGLLKYKLKF